MIVNNWSDDRLRAAMPTGCSLIPEMADTVRRVLRQALVHGRTDEWLPLVQLRQPLGMELLVAIVGNVGLEADARQNPALGGVTVSCRMPAAQAAQVRRQLLGSLG